MTTDDSIPVFGTRIPGRDYVPRPSAYAVVRNQRGAVLLVRTKKGHLLPGGAIEAGESAAAAAARETREECALVVEPIREIGRAVQLVFAADENACFEKQSVFWTARLTGERDRSKEPEHEKVWLPVEEAVARLLHESHVWAVKKAEEER